VVAGTAAFATLLTEPIHAGEPALVVVAAANRDPAIFAEHRADLGGQCFQGRGPDASDLRQTPATVTD